MECILDADRYKGTLDTIEHAGIPIVTANPIELSVP
jgi:hypothetical protein